MVTRTRALPLGLPDGHLLFVDRAWMLVGNDTWEAHRRAEIIMRLVMSPRVAHDNCPSDVGSPRSRTGSIRNPAAPR